MTSHAPVERAPRPTGPSFRHVALPAEHGSWSLVLEPILLGLLVAPTWAGLALAVSGFAAFLAHRPLKLALGDRRRGRSYGRTPIARKWAAIYLTVALLGLIVGTRLAGLQPLLPIALAVPFMLLFAYFDRKPGRSWQAELSAPVGFSAIVAAIALAGGLDWPVALALWGAMVGRAVPAVLFVRARLRLDKGKPARAAGALLAHLLALLGVGALVAGGWLPRTAALAMIILLARAAWGLSDYRWRSSVKGLGFLEMGFGFLTVVLIALGYRLG
jgi:hypothetical protein